MVSRALEAKDFLASTGINIRVVDMWCIKPIDREVVIKCATETKKLISIEDHSVYGGLGDAIADVLIEECPKKLIKIGVRDKFGTSRKSRGSFRLLWSYCRENNRRGEEIGICKNSY
jgi:transketolase